MIASLYTLAVILLVPVAIIDAIFLCEIAFGLAPPKPVNGIALATDVALIVPAHNEEATLSVMLPGLARLRDAGTRILLVADNCTDNTAALARQAGIEVTERHDPMRRGKGYALAHGRASLALDPPAIVVVLDADCAIDAPSLARLAARAHDAGRVVQAAYLFRPALTASAAVQVSNFAFATKNVVRQRGISRIGGAAILTGSGMAFPWDIFATLDLATGDVVEDLALGIELIDRELPPVFAADLTVWSDSSGDAGTETQRARWEGGFLSTARRVAPRLLVTGIAQRRWDKFWMGTHLLVPPLTMLLLANIVVMAITLTIAGVTGIGGPAAINGALLCALAAAVAAAWLVEGHRHIRGKTLIRLPFYVVWKLALYANMISGKRAIAWIRTERSDGR